MGVRNCVAAVERPLGLAAMVAATSGFALGVNSAAAAELDVASVAELTAVLSAAQPGDRIRLAPGHYGALDLRGRQFTPAIVVESRDPNAPARFSSVRLTDVTGVSLQGLSVAFGATAAPLTSHAVYLQRVRDVAIVGGEIQSSDDGDAGNDAGGVYVRDGRNVRIEGAHLHDVARGATILESNGVTVEANRFDAIGIDGVAGGGVENFTVEGNLFRDFELRDPVKHHPDAVQLWDKNATRANRNVMIRRNVVLRGVGDATQGFISRTPGLQTDGLVIEENVIHQSMGQGIGVENARNLVIRRNTVAAAVPDVDAPAIDVRAPGADVVIADNLAAGYRLADGVDASSNVTLSYDDPWAEGYAEARLAAPLEGAEAVLADFAPLTAAGARGFALKAPGAARAEGAIDIRHQPLGIARYAFSAANAAPSQWRVYDRGEALINEAAGETAQFDFSSAGLMRVEAEGRGAFGSKHLRVPPAVLADLTFAGGRVADAAPEPAPFEGAPTSLGADGGAAFASFDGAAHIKAVSPAFTTALRLQIDLRMRRSNATGDWERLISVPGAYFVRLRGDRALAMFWNRDGEKSRLDVTAAGLSDGAWHDVSIVYDGAEGRLSLSVDGDSVGSAAAAGGAVNRRETQPLYVGGEPWGAGFNGDIERLVITR